MSNVSAIPFLALLPLRYFDIRHMQGETADGKPATMKDLKRYSLFVGLFASVVWGIAIAVATVSVSR